MLQNGTFFAKIGADTAENEQHFANILPKFCRSAVVSPTGAMTSPGAGSTARLGEHAILCSPDAASPGTYTWAADVLPPAPTC